MMSSAGSEADTPPPTPPLSEKLARQLLRSEVGDHPSPEELAAAMTGIYTRLRARLAVFLGEQGFDALWRRAVHLARREFHAWDDAAGEEPSPALPPGLHGVVRGGDAAEAHARLIAAFARFIALLFTFIGEDLGVRIEVLARRTGLPEGSSLTAALERLVSLGYATKLDEGSGTTYRPVAQSLR